MPIRKRAGVPRAPRTPKRQRSMPFMDDSDDEWLTASSTDSDTDTDTDSDDEAPPLLRFSEARPIDAAAASRGGLGPSLFGKPTMPAMEDFKLPIRTSLPTMSGSALLSVGVPAVSLQNLVSTPETIRAKWHGTSLYQPADHLTSLSEGDYQMLIQSHVGALADVRAHPYDPECWIRLALSHSTLFNGELCVASAYNALKLIYRAKSPPSRLSPYVIGPPVKLRSLVRRIIARRLTTRPPSRSEINEKLRVLRLVAFKGLLAGLRDCKAWYDGVPECQLARQLDPFDDDFLDFQEDFESELRDRVIRVLDAGFQGSQARVSIGVAEVYKRQYPWLDQKLFSRSPELLSGVNQGLQSAWCEVRPQNGVPSNQDATEDVGPLGIYAKRRIIAGTTLFIDHSVTAISNIPPSLLRNCEACHASLHPEHLATKPIIASCCGKAAYCSGRCHAVATGENGYHRVLCGKDFDWLYGDVAVVTPGPFFDSTWLPLLLLRCFAVVLASFAAIDGQVKNNSGQRVTRRFHPLQHPLFARLTAGYTTPSADERSMPWTFMTDVVLPNRILETLGVDTLARTEWSSETVQTAMWRLNNNACTSKTLTNDGVADREWDLACIMSDYSLFNHRCKENTIWSVAGPGHFPSPPTGETSSRSNRAVLARGAQKGRAVLVESGNEIGGVRAMQLIPAGSSAMICIATRDIEPDEECCVSYLPVGHRGDMSRWFDGPCRCVDCVG
ncbi:MAG: hypothetical protein M1818_002347 [Claussenomyces sp. TS43310]|nr:MAG: hypothetical protein M1818_002347 [Claussenomyces sp. TS43310]